MRWYSDELAESLVVTARQMARNLMGAVDPIFCLSPTPEYIAMGRVMSKKSDT